MAGITSGSCRHCGVQLASRDQSFGRSDRRYPTASLAIAKAAAKAKLGPSTITLRPIDSSAAVAVCAGRVADALQLKITQA
jgi:hypothetical protein